MKNIDFENLTDDQLDRLVNDFKTINMNIPNSYAKAVVSDMKAEIKSKMNMKEEVMKLKAQIEQESNVIFGKAFLELTGLKIGDEVECYFSSSRGDSKNSYTNGGYHKGIIKQYESGTLYVESVEKLTQSYNTSNNRSGRDRRSWWVYEDKFTKAPITDIAYTQAGRV